MKRDGKIIQPEKPGIVRTIFRILLGVFLISAGVNHLTAARAEFLAQVP